MSFILAVVRLLTIYLSTLFTSAATILVCLGSYLSENRLTQSPGVGVQEGERDAPMFVHLSPFA